MASSNLNMLKITSSNSHSDECYTPNIAIKPLLPFLPKNKIIFEPTSFHSLNIVTFLSNNGFYVIDNNDNKNFLQDKLPYFDIIVTNPPYSLKDKFIQKCYSLNKPFALLLPVSALQGAKRGNLFAKYGIQLLVLNQRIDFTGKKSPHFGVAWFCYNLLPKSLIFVNIK